MKISKFKVHKFVRVNSTNTLAKEYATNSVLVAEAQSKGRGRFARHWTANKGGLWFSVVLKPDRRLFEYTFIASLAVLKAISVKEARIKWPNDIIYSDGRKICGILSEVVSSGEKAERVIIGIGINVNNTISSKLKGIAVNLYEIDGKKRDLDELLNKILMNVLEINRWKFDKILSDCKKNSGILGNKVTIQSLDGIFSGKAINIDNEGNLVLDVKGKKIKVNEGDVSLV